MINEPSKAREQVIALLRRDGDMAKPSDTKCIANAGGGKRCNKDITFVLEADYWSKFCEAHTKQDEDARQSGKARVEKVSIKAK